MSELLEAYETSWWIARRQKVAELLKSLGVSEAGIRMVSLAQQLDNMAFSHEAGMETPVVRMEKAPEIMAVMMKEMTRVVKEINQSGRKPEVVAELVVARVYIKGILISNKEEDFQGVVGSGRGNLEVGDIDDLYDPAKRAVKKALRYLGIYKR
ncbi:hypothetical protein M1116_01850 [Patescibacteria group bacterium]|nr:hypothetical protein [Patescibacteria group bacterium]